MKNENNQQNKDTADTAIPDYEPSKAGHKKVGTEEDTDFNMMEDVEER